MKILFFSSLLHFTDVHLIYFLEYLWRLKCYFPIVHFIYFASCKSIFIRWAFAWFRAVARSASYQLLIQYTAQTLSQVDFRYFRKSESNNKTTKDSLIKLEDPPTEVILPFAPFFFQFFFLFLFDSHKLRKRSFEQRQITWTLWFDVLTWTEQFYWNRQWAATRNNKENGLHNEMRSSF